MRISAQAKMTHGPLLPSQWILERPPTHCARRAYKNGVSHAAESLPDGPLQDEGTARADQAKGTRGNYTTQSAKKLSAKI